MPIVTNGKRIAVLPNRNEPHHSTGGRIIARMRAGERVFKVVCNKKERTISILNDLGIIREHFDASVSEALRLAVRLTANSIRANRALPEVNNDD